MSLHFVESSQIVHYSDHIFMSLIRNWDGGGGGYDDCPIQILNISFEKV